MKLSTAITQFGAATIKTLSLSGSPSSTASGNGNFARAVLGRGFNRDEYEPASRVGDPRTNSLVCALQKQQTNAFCEAPPVVQRRDDLGHWQYDTNAAILDLLYKPNEWWGWTDLVPAMLSDITYRGYSTLFLVLGRGRVPKSLVWIPAQCVKPIFLAGGTKWIDYWEYQPLGSGQLFQLQPEDVLLFNSEEVDPANGRIGRSRLASLFPEMAVDKEDTLYSASVSFNAGVPSCVISNNDPENVDWDDETASKLERMMLERTAGNKRGRPLVLTDNVTVTPLSFKPSEMASDRAIAKVEARICQAFGVHPSVAASVLGVENSKMATLKQAYEMFWEQAILPVHRRIGDALTRQLLPYYEDVTRNVRVSFDLREVRALQQDKLELSTMLTEQWRFGGIDRETYQVALGYAPGEGSANLYYTDTIAQLPSGGGVSDDPDKNKEDGQKPKSPARDQKA